MKTASYKEILEIILNFSSDGILVTDINGKPVAYSETYRKYLGASKDLLKAKTIKDLFDDGWLSTPVVYKVIETRQPYTDLVTYYKTNKKILVTGIPVLKENNQLEYVILTFRDLSVLKKLEEELNAQKKIIDKYKFELHRLKSGTEQLTRNKEMLKVQNLIKSAAKHDSPIILFGETGVGKSMFAKKIHEMSNRSETGQFIKVDCASIPENLLELELFGYEQGAFTDAKKEGKEGLIELADKGTFFLDEIGELSLLLQSKLLSTLEDKRVRRIGGTKYKEVDIRIISAANQDLKEMIGRKKFRRDLFYRLNVLPITIPPLRERKEDIIPFIKHFEELFSIKYNVEKRISPKTYHELVNYDWPGNIRELIHLVERLLLMDEEMVLREIKGGKEGKSFIAADDTPTDNFTLKEYMSIMEKKYMLRMLSSSNTLKEAATKMDIEISTLVRKKQKYHLNKNYQ